MNKKILLLILLSITILCVSVTAYKIRKIPPSSEKIEESFALEMLLGAVQLLDEQKALTNFDGEVNHQAILKIMPPDFGGLKPPLSVGQNSTIYDASGHKVWIYRFQNVSGTNSLSNKYKIIVHAYGANSVNDKGYGDDSFWGLRWDGGMDRFFQ